MPKITIYTGINCPFCEKAVDLINKLGQSYSLLNVQTNLEARETFLKLCAEPGQQQTVPKIVINDTLISGFDELQHLADTGALITILEN